MENIHKRLAVLNDSLKNLNLESEVGLGENQSDNKLLGKVLTKRSFRRFTIAEITTKIWRLKRLVKVDKMEDNIFKFLFGSEEDRDHIYNLRPWSLDEAHLILKLWPDNKVLREISFDTATLWVQVHGLAPAILHQNTAEKIGSRIGLLHMDTVNRKSVVAHRYLRVRVDISLKNPIPAGFFYEMVDGDELWVQLKCERLPDFCFKCRYLDHVTGRYRFESPATITSAYGISTKTFGSWLKEEVAGSSNFVNIPEEEDSRGRALQKGKSLEIVVFDQHIRDHFNERTAEGVEEHDKTNPAEEIQNACNMCFE